MWKKTPGGWTAHDVPDQSEKRFVVTGASSGIGLETARVLAARGGHVILAVRSVDKGEAAMADIAAGLPDASLEVGELDLADLASVRAFAAWMDAGDRGVDVLINNAGIMAVPQGTTVDGFELQLGTNHLGHFALTGLLMPRLLETEGARVVTVSSLAHRGAEMHFDDLQLERSYGRQKAYGASKLANLLFTMELQRRVRRIDRRDVMSLAAHPGLAQSNLPAGITGGLYDHLRGVLEKASPLVAQSAADGALPTLRAATDPDVSGGDYFGPNGFGEFRGPAVKVKARPSAYDVHDARALWEASIELTGVDYSVLEPG